MRALTQTTTYIIFVSITAMFNIESTVDNKMSVNEREEFITITVNRTGYLDTYAVVGKKQLLMSSS